MKKLLSLTFIMVFSGLISGKNFYSYSDANKDSLAVTSLFMQSDSNYTFLDFSIFPKLQHIDFSNCNLEKIPASIFSLVHLKSINLSGNSSLDVADVAQLFEQNKNLVNLDLSRCELYFLPNEIGAMKELKSLNLSYNKLSALPEGVQKCVQLEYFNISWNRLKELKLDLQEFHSLKDLNVAYNSNLKFTGFLSDSVQLERVNVLGVDSVPAALFSNRIKQLAASPSAFEKTGGKKGEVEDLTINKMKYEDYNFACNSLEKDKIKSVSFESDELKRLPVAITSAKNCEKLSLASNEIASLGVPLKRMSSLQTLSFYTPKLKSIIKELSGLNTLTFLDIEKTNIPVEEVLEIQKMFPNLRIKFSSKIGFPVVLQNEKPKKRYIVPPVKQYIDQGIKAAVDNQMGNVIVGEKGTVVTINPNCFQYSDGSIVREMVEVKLVEYYDPVDVYLSGIPMAYDSAGTSYSFYSGGMFSIQAKTASGKEVQIDKNIPIEVTMPRKEAEGLSFYYFDTINGKWVNKNEEIKTNPVLSRVVNGSGTWLGANTSIWGAGLAAEPTFNDHLKGTIMDSRCYFDRDNNLLFSMQSSGVNKKFDRVHQWYRNDFKNKFPLDHLNPYVKLQWQVEKEDQDRFVEFAEKNFQKKNKSQFEVSRRKSMVLFKNVLDVQLIANGEEDNFNIVLLSTTDTISFKAFPVIENKTLSNLGHFHRRSFKRYTKKRSKGEAFRDSSMKNYQRALDNFYVSLSTWKKEQKQYAGGIEESEAEAKERNEKYRLACSLAEELVVGNQLSRKVPVTNLGVHNCDQIRKELYARGESLYVYGVTEKGDTVNMNGMALLTTWGSGYVNFWDNKLGFFKNYKNAVIKPLPNGTLAVYPSENMGLLVGKESAFLNVLIVDPVLVGKDELKKIINL